MKALIKATSKALTRKSDNIVICGDGRTLDADMDIISSWGIKHDTACLGRCVKRYKADHWLNADGETAIAWAKQLKANGNGLITHTLGAVEGFDVDWDIEQSDYHYADITHDSTRFHGSSALFATLAMLEIGYERVILAGCPLDQEGHYYFKPTGPETLGPVWLGMDFMAWLDFKETERAQKVRSMSGYTAKILGKVEEQWLTTYSTTR